MHGHMAMQVCLRRLPAGITSAHPPSSSPHYFTLRRVNFWCVRATQLRVLGTYWGQSLAARAAITTGSNPQVDTWFVYDRDLAG